MLLRWESLHSYILYINIKGMLVMASILIKLQYLNIYTAVYIHVW
jgi:hypothetical protein